MSVFTDDTFMLREVCDGVLCRLTIVKSNLSTDAGKPHVLKNEDYKKLRNHLIKTFPEIPNDDEEKKFGPALDNFIQNAGMFLEEMEPIYYDFLDALEVLEKSHSTLRDVANHKVRMDFKTNRHNMINFMELFVKYCQINLTWASIDDAKGILACYNYAHKCNTGTTEKDATRLSQFIKEVAEPWKKIRNDMADIKEKMGESLLSLFTAYMQCAHTDGLLNKQILSTIQDNGTIVVPSFKDDLTNLTYFDYWQRWIIYGFLACPSQLSKVEALLLWAEDCGDDTRTGGIMRKGGGRGHVSFFIFAGCPSERYSWRWRSIAVGFRFAENCRERWLHD